MQTSRPPPGWPRAPTRTVDFCSRLLVATGTADGIRGSTRSWPPPAGPTRVRPAGRRRGPGRFHALFGCAPTSPSGSSRCARTPSPCSTVIDGKITRITGFPSEVQPSKPWAFRSRRCRRRTWRSCGGARRLGSGRLQGRPRAVRAGFLRTSPPRRSSPASAPAVPRGPRQRSATSSRLRRTTASRPASSSTVATRCCVVARQKGTAKGEPYQLDQLFAFVWTVQGGRRTRPRSGSSPDRAPKPSKPPGCGSSRPHSPFTLRASGEEARSDIGGSPLPTSPDGLADAPGLRPESQGGRRCVILSTLN